MEQLKSFEVKIVYDNKCVEHEGFVEGFGFSALIRNISTQDYILFDTGSDGKILVQNIKKFDVNPSDIKKVVISHNHFDHAGGLNAIYELNPDIEIHVPINDLLAFNRVFPYADVRGSAELEELEVNVYLSGQFGDFMKEQALFLRTRSNEIVIIVGCTHPGLEKFIIKARELGRIKAVIGGFHGFSKFSYLEGVDFIGACHCTQKMKALKEKFPNNVKKICVGTSSSF